MSRGHGIWQRCILDRIAKSDKLIPLGGATRSESAAILRAAKRLEALGFCVIVRVWSEDHRVVRPYVGRPGLTFDGRPVVELSVARVPSHGTVATLTGSLRDLARREGVSKTQVWRDLHQRQQQEPI